MTEQEIFELKCINTIRTLSIDAVQAANSGHPGTPMAMAPVVYCLWDRFLRFDPEDPIWPNRDRFVLSAGHASMLLYSMLHLTGVKAVNPDYEVLGQPAVTLDDIKHFRQLGSKCPGHPEYRMVSGIETTTGPLGQGVATSVGMAIASKWMAAHFNRPGFEMFDFRVYSLAGDGCMMEGISNEAASLAGHLAALQPVLDLRQQPHHDRGQHGAGVQRRRRHPFPGLRMERVAGERRQLVAFPRTGPENRARDHRPADLDHRGQSHRIRRARHKHDTSAAHGEPLGEDEVRGAKRNYGWPEDAKFLVPDDVRQHFADAMRKRGSEGRKAWLAKFAEYEKAFPALADEINRMQRRELPDGMGRRTADFQGRPQRHRQPRFLGPGAQRDCAPRALAYRRSRRLCRPRPRPGSRSREPVISRRIASAATSTSVSARMRWRRFSTACR